MLQRRADLITGKNDIGQLQWRNHYCLGAVIERATESRKCALLYMMVIYPIKVVDELAGRVCLWRNFKEKVNHVRKYYGSVFE